MWPSKPPTPDAALSEAPYTDLLATNASRDASATRVPAAREARATDELQARRCRVSDLESLSSSQVGEPSSPATPQYGAYFPLHIEESLVPLFS